MTDATPSLDKLRAEAAKAQEYYDLVKHGKDAFMGSSAWSNYVHVNAALANARATLAAAEAARPIGDGFCRGLGE